METEVISGVVTLALLGSLAVFVALECSPRAQARRDAARRRRQEGLNAREQAPERATGLTALDLQRLGAFRQRALDLHGEPIGPMTWGRWWGHIRRRGYVAWIVTSFVGAFSMATHFALLWFVYGGGWVGATVVTIASAVAMSAVGVMVVIRIANRG